MLFKVIHIGRLHGPTKDLQSTQGRNVGPTRILLDKQGQRLDALELDVLEFDRFGRFSQVFIVQLQGLFWSYVIAVFKAQVFPVHVQVNAGGVFFRIEALIEASEFEGMDLR